ncbi:hypothetical protein GCM10028805_51930 [Spirosoma harenae]
MNSLELTIKTGQARHHHWRFSGPSAWEELTPRQAIALIRFRERVNDSLEILFVVLQLLYKMTPTQQRWLFDEAFLVRKGIDTPVRHQALRFGQALIDTLDWIGVTTPGPMFLVPSFRLYDFQYGSARVLLRRTLFPTLYYAPAESLSNLTFGEFIYSENAYNAKNWPELAAILYRPGKGLFTKGIDPREAFDEDKVDGRAERFAELDPALLTLIVHHYEASRQVLQQYFEHVFSVGDEPQTTSTPTGKKASWLNVAISLAKLDVTKVEEIKTANLYLALQVLDEQIRQADELEAELAKTKTK